MNWTFGIVTGGGQETNINLVIDSIEKQNIPKDQYEIIIVGSYNSNRSNVVKHPFDENVKTGWITKKKNMIAYHARFENIMMSHDYVALMDGWYSGFLKFGGDWDVCMNPIVRKNGERFRDWVTWREQYWGTPKHIEFLDYSNHSITNEMYVSGTYFCVKKQFMLQHPLDERLVWGQGEDVEWSKRVRSFWKYRCNSNSSVIFVKDK